MTTWPEMLDRIYANPRFGEAATLTVGGTPHAVTVVEASRGTASGDRFRGDDGRMMDVHTGRFACAVRASELEAAGIALPQLYRAGLTYSGKAWRVESHEPRPLPDGPGEVVLYLAKASESA